MTKESLTVGVVGGMGPEATVEFMRRVIAETPADDDADHIRLLVDNNPKVPSRIAAILENSGDDPGKVLAAMARGLEAAGADFLVVPCNTAHYYLPIIRDAVGIRVLDAIELTADYLKANMEHIKKVGMLISPAAQRVAIFDQQFCDHGLSTLYPDVPDQAIILSVIQSIKAGNISASVLAAYQSIAQRLVDAGADVLLIACTELSTLPRPDVNVAIVDTLEVMVIETIATATGGSSSH